ncbi:MAG: lipoate--protein ligase family protein [Simkaniaceae bacterium]|nr:lipoate--protein ligase family protein [Simkaniaceae bacterium]
MWRVIHGKKRSAEENMAFDADLLEEIQVGDDPILHFYEWDGPCLTYGYFLKPSDFLNLEKCRELGVSMARRPTGGGIIFHIGDLAFAAVVPAGDKGYFEKTLDNYTYINEKVKRAIEKVAGGVAELLPVDPVARTESCGNFCMAKPTIYDVMIGERKVAGAAQRKRKNGYLHQGSISIHFPKEVIEAVVLPGRGVIEAMDAETFEIAGELEVVREKMKQALIEVFNE